MMEISIEWNISFEHALKITRTLFKPFTPVHTHSTSVVQYQISPII